VTRTNFDYNQAQCNTALGKIHHFESGQPGARSSLTAQHRTRHQLQPRVTASREQLRLFRIRCARKKNSTLVMPFPVERLRLFDRVEPARVRRRTGY
jgi:hypothetical protein